jgi:plastocyanin
VHVRFTLAVAVLLALALPAVADAATKSVSVGTPRQSQKTFQRAASDVNAFFPNRVVIAAGDSIRFVPAGFHTVDLPVRGRGPLPVFAPTGAAIAGQADPAGAPFWFNGQPTLGFNPALLTSGYGKRFSYTGAKRVDTGLPVANNPKPMTVRFPRAGTYTYYCDVHTGMKGTVVVRPAGSTTPATSTDQRRVRRQTSAALRVARSLGSTTSPPGVVKVGAAGRGGVERFQFFPSTLTVPVGTVLKFTLTPGSREVHTATTGPGNPESEPNSFLGQIEASINGPSPNQALFYPSDPPGTVANLTPTLHGNGFWTSGVMDAVSASPLPPANSVRFAAPGIYQFYCLIHPFMHATITAQ